ncbi:MAG: hypothetical protein VX699_10585 [Myxococcota bacterium]|nr:hypothetical protein [Myxococcota bacterium]
MRNWKKPSNPVHGRRLAGAALVLLLTLGPPGLAQAEEIVIVKTGHSTKQLPRKRLKKLLLGKSKKWPSGEKVILAVLTHGPTHENFIKKHARKTPKQFTNYWRKLVFSGKGKMPKSFSSEEELIKFVARTPGALGYVDSATRRDGVTALPVN